LPNDCVASSPRHASSAHAERSHVNAGVVDQHVDWRTGELRRERTHLGDARDVHALDANIRVLGHDRL